MATAVREFMGWRLVLGVSGFVGYWSYWGVLKAVKCRVVVLGAVTAMILVFGGAVGVGVVVL